MINPFLKTAILKHKSPYSAVLPYNINWFSKKLNDLIEDNKLSPIIFVDVGCRGGIPNELYPIKENIYHIGFDADPEVKKSVDSKNEGLSRREIYSEFIGGHNKDINFYIYKNKGQSSALLPDKRFKDLFGGAKFKVEKTTALKSITLDEFFSLNPEIPSPDMIKLDTQGTELEILRGAQKCLKTTSMVECEIEFMPIYKNQPLFEDVLAEMRNKGFELLYLNRVFQQRKNFKGWAKGQLTFGDALFCLREDNIDHLDRKSLQNFIILLLNYGYIDIAYHIVKKNSLSEEMRIIFEDYIMQLYGNIKYARVKKHIIPLIDKIILFLMHLRGHNSKYIDSDRAWPYR